MGLLPDQPPLPQISSSPGLVSLIRNWVGMAEKIQPYTSLLSRESILISIRLKCIFPNYFILMIIKESTCTYSFEPKHSLIGKKAEHVK